MFVVAEHVIICSRGSDFGHPPMLETHNIGSFAGRWRPLAHLDPDNILNPSILTPIHVDDLGIGQIWRPHPTVGMVVQLELYPSPLRRDTWKLMIYIANVAALDTAMAPATFPRTGILGSIFRRKTPAVPTPRSSRIFTYHLSGFAPQTALGASDLNMVQISVTPAFGWDYFDDISYAEYGSFVDRLEGYLAFSLKGDKFHPALQFELARCSFRQLMERAITSLDMFRMSPISYAGYFWLVQTKAKIENHRGTFTFGILSIMNHPDCNPLGSYVSTSCAALLNLLNETNIDGLCEPCRKCTVTWVWGTGHGTREKLLDEAIAALMSPQTDEPIRAVLYNNRELAQKPHEPHAAFGHCAKLQDQLTSSFLDFPSRVSHVLLSALAPNRCRQAHADVTDEYNTNNQVNQKLLHVLDDDVLLTVLSLCDVNKTLRVVALEKSVCCSSLDLITQVQRLVYGPTIWTDSSSEPTVSRLAPIELPTIIGDDLQPEAKVLLGGKYVVVSNETSFSCWELRSKKRLWGREDARFLAVEMFDDGTSARCLLLRYDLEPLYTDLDLPF
ncbi:hypothetical protein DFH09DRAFT_1317578 [Mycena vulgaris]|nr:hypothetical protein DFH09DRAFT_1317578 [Mycena vulgaris]